jgi:hypothetical protein
MAIPEKKNFFSSIFLPPSIGFVRDTVNNKKKVGLSEKY